jgi:pimeloyl-ACP methyl ester carboxylesterase
MAGGRIDCLIRFPALGPNFDRNMGGPPGPIRPGLAGFEPDPTGARGGADEGAVLNRPDFEVQLVIRSTTRGDAAITSIDRDRIVDWGDGPETLVFLHGLFGTPEHWLNVMKDMAGQYRVVAPQLPIDPHPQRRSRGVQGVADLRLAVAAMIDELQIESFVLCGNSLGGLVAIDYCLAHPNAVKGLVLSGSAGLFERSPIRGLSSHTSREFVRDTISGILYDQSLVTDQLVDHWYRSIKDRDYARFLLRVARATRDRVVAEELAKLNVLTMIIWGSNDQITPPSTARDFQRLIAGSQLEFIDDCGHAPNWERPEAFAAILDGFLPCCFA